MNKAKILLVDDEPIERALVFSEGERIQPDALRIEAPSSIAGGLRIPGARMAEIEKYAILTTLEAVQGSTTRAAEILGVSIRTIQYRLRKYGLVPSVRQRRNEPDMPTHSFFDAVEAQGQAGDVPSTADITLALPHIVGGAGVIATIPMTLDPAEVGQLRWSATVLREAINSLRLS